nr:unnamed protein product [Trichobilharzia regenti]
MVQTGDLSVETGDVGGGSIGTCPATYRLESESFEHLKQESNSRAKLNECLGMKEYANEVADTGIPEKSTNAGVLPSEYTPSPPPHPHPTTTPRSTLVAQLRYSLLKQKLKLLRARDAYYLRRRIVSHLEKFLDQAITSDSCISLPNSIPEDWDTDTASVLSDLFDDNGGNFSKSGVGVHPTIPEFNPFKNNHSDNMIKSSERKSTSDKCVCCPDKRHSTQEENVQRKESKSALKKSCFNQDGCCQNDSTEGFKTCTQEGDNSGNRQAKSSSSPVIHQKFQCDRKPTTTTQFADLKKRAEHQLGEMIMKLKTNQSDSPSQSTTASCPCMHCENCRSILAGYITDGIKFTKSYDDDDGGYRQSSKYTPMRKLFVAEACAASGGISWFQPLNQSRLNNKNIERKSAKDNKRSNVIKCLYREIPCRFGVSSTMNQSIGSDDHQQQLGRKYTTATAAAAAANCLHTLHNHSCHNGGEGFCDTESNDSSTAKQKSSSEAEEVEEGDNNVKEKPETLKSSIITKMRCNQHQDTESFSSSITDGVVVDLHPGQKNSPISKRITYEIRDNIYGAESNIQTLFKKRMSAWISRCEERQKRLHLASAERRYQKAMDMERTQLFHPTLSDQYTRRPLSSHLSKVDPCHCGFESGVGGSRRGDRSTWRDISNCCVHCFRNSNNQTAQSNRSNNGDGGGWGGDDNRCLNPMSSRKDVRQASVNLPSHRSTLSYKTNSGRRSARSGNETRSYRNYVQNQVYIQESKLAQLRVNRLRMKIYGEKILRSVLQRRGPWSMTFKEV